MSSSAAMTHPIEYLVLGAEFSGYTVLYSETKPNHFGPLARINVLVGANNSGKSRFLRKMAAQASLEFVPPTEGAASIVPIREARDYVAKGLQEAFSKAGISDADGILRQIASLGKFNSMQEGENLVTPFLEALEQLSNKQSVHDVTTPQGIHSGSDAIASSIRRIARKAKERLPSGGEARWRKLKFRKIYVPTLRTLRAIEPAELFENRTRSDYFADQKHLEVFTGQSLYRDVRRLLLGNLGEREVIAQYQQFIGESFFGGSAVALIPKEGQGQCVLDIKIGDELEFPVQNLGDGIQSILALTFPLFLHRDEDLLVFFEEPELYLHPGLQRILLSVLSGQFPKHQYFLTTHSNHFLDITLDEQSVSVFTFHKTLDGAEGREREARFEIENVSSADRRTLELLGARNSSVLLSNCTIWVEGITDRRYFAHYLKLYQAYLAQTKSPAARPSPFKEDLHYSFVEYGGGNVTHWSFLDDVPDAVNVDRLCGRLMLVTDSDGAGPGSAKEQRQQKLQEKLRERYVLLPCREVENLIAPQVLMKVVSSYEGDAPSVGEPAHADYQGESLGTFIDELLGAGKKRRGNYAAKSGTVTDKVGFCDRAVEAMPSWECLSEPAKTVTKRLYDFIASHNS